MADQVQFDPSFSADKCEYTGPVIRPIHLAPDHPVLGMATERMVLSTSHRPGEAVEVLVAMVNEPICLFYAMPPEVAVKFGQQMIDAGLDAMANGGPPPKPEPEVGRG